jgi:hypothetical protein
MRQRLPCNGAGRWQTRRTSLDVAVPQMLVKWRWIGTFCLRAGATVARCGSRLLFTEQAGQSQQRSYQRCRRNLLLHNGLANGRKPQRSLEAGAFASGTGLRVGNRKDNHPAILAEKKIGRLALRRPDDNPCYMVRRRGPCRWLGRAGAQRRAACRNKQHQKVGHGILTS